jgi:hypothetical protein
MRARRTLVHEALRQPKVSFGYRFAVLIAGLFLLVITSPTHAGNHTTSPPLTVSAHPFTLSVGNTQYTSMLNAPF